MMSLIMMSAVMGAAPDVVRADWWDARIGHHFVEEAGAGGVALAEGFSFGFVQGQIGLPDSGRWLVTMPVRTPGALEAPSQYASLRINGEEIAVVESFPPQGVVEVSTIVTGMSFSYNFEFLEPFEESFAELVIEAGVVERLCDGDFNGDRIVNVLDLVAFHRAFVNDDLAADCNNDGDVSLLDYICFQPMYQRGCN